MYKHLVWDKSIRGKIRGKSCELFIKNYSHCLPKRQETKFFKKRKKNERSILNIIIFVILFPIYNHTQAEIGWSDRDRRSFTIMKEYGLYHVKKCWFKTHIVLFFPFWALCEKGSCVGYICIVWSILMINTSMASKEVRLLSKEEGRKESSIGLLSSTYYLVLWEAIIWKSPSPPTSPSY